MSTTPATYALPPPTNDTESARLKLQHEFSLIDANGALHRCQLPSPLNRVADIGTGTGIWAKAFAELHTEAQVTGLDLAAPPQNSSGTPPNVGFVTGNIQEAWPISPEHKFDLIHGRQILLNLPDPKAALRQAYKNLRPGGIIEFREWDCPMKCQVQEGRPLPLIIEWSERLRDSARILNGCDHEFSGQLADAIKEVGFVDVNVETREFPIGGWLMGTDEDDFGRQQKLDRMVRDMWQFGMGNMARTMFVKAFGWTETEAVEYAGKVLEDLEREDLARDKVSWGFKIVWARKPAVGGHKL
ncbi:S-adenosyl-L-methionine-dependent methyltransferase [Cladorrhinum sp. PSN259]|nr:S-adenosyl-L-methionine-dependent methyltransferase [Cladorrhinum sp. PSN259]